MPVALPPDFKILTCFMYVFYPGQKLPPLDRAAFVDDTTVRIEIRLRDGDDKLVPAWVDADLYLDRKLERNGFDAKIGYDPSVSEFVSMTIHESNATHIYELHDSPDEGESADN